MNVLALRQTKNPFKYYDLKGFDKFCINKSGELGIRTPGGFHLNSFQDCRNRPLCQLSVAKIRVQILKTKEFYILKKNEFIANL